MKCMSMLHCYMFISRFGKLNGVNVPWHNRVTELQLDIRSTKIRTNKIKQIMLCYVIYVHLLITSFQQFYNENLLNFYYLFDAFNSIWVIWFERWMINSITKSWFIIFYCLLNSVYHFVNLKNRLYFFKITKHNPFRRQFKSFLK